MNWRRRKNGNIGNSRNSGNKHGCKGKGKTGAATQTVFECPVRACKTISWANMKEQRSEALLLFHALKCKKCHEPPDNSSPMACGRY
jgi:hypothetical protein